MEIDFSRLAEDRRELNGQLDSVEELLSHVAIPLRAAWNDITWLETQIGVLMEAGKIIQRHSERNDSGIRMDDGDPRNAQGLEALQKIVQSFTVRLTDLLEPLILTLSGTPQGSDRQTSAATARLGGDRRFRCRHLPCGSGPIQPRKTEAT